MALVHVFELIDPDEVLPPGITIRAATPSAPLTQQDLRVLALLDPQLVPEPDEELRNVACETEMSGACSGARLGHRRRGVEPHEHA